MRNRLRKLLGSQHSFFLWKRKAVSEGRAKSHDGGAKSNREQWLGPRRAASCSQKRRTGPHGPGRIPELFRTHARHVPSFRFLFEWKYLLPLSYLCLPLCVEHVQSIQLVSFTGFWVQRSHSRGTASPPFGVNRNYRIWASEPDAVVE